MVVVVVVSAVAPSIGGFSEEGGGGVGVGRGRGGGGMEGANLQLDAFFPSVLYYPPPLNNPLLPPAPTN